MTTYRFEHENEDAGFDPVGNAEGFGDNAVLGAWTEIEQARGCAMPAGTYRYVPVDSPDSEDWDILQVVANGVVILVDTAMAYEDDSVGSRRLSFT
jgi:hypothetical protein